MTTNINPILKQPYHIGILGGGQLAKMMAQAALQFGCEISILERKEVFPASGLSSRTVIGDWDNPETLYQFAQEVNVITLENEFVNADGLALLEKRGISVCPSSNTIRLVQDKLLQKQALQKAGLPVLRFNEVKNPACIEVYSQEFGLPLLLKKRRNGYDGKGNVTIRSIDKIQEAWETLNGNSHPLFVEAFCNFTTELAVIITRAKNGNHVIYPVVETIQENHICRVVKAPADLPLAIITKAKEIALNAVEAVGGVGSFGVEMFTTKNGEIIINELAPRVHNSGHYTIEACEYSQFENHIRAALGWPLGSPRMLSPAAVMINLLASGNGSGNPVNLPNALTVEGAHIHIYGKTQSIPERKMGHVTSLGRNIEEAEKTAQQAASAIKFGD